MTWSIRMPAGVAHAGSDGPDERLVPAARSRHGMNGGRPQSWTERVELVGRCADAHVEGEDVLAVPGVGAVRVDADREVVRSSRRWPRPAAARSISHCSQAWKRTRSA